MSMKLLGKVVAVTTALGATTAMAETLILAEGLPNNHYHSTGISEPLMKCITEGTNGAIDFTYMPGGQLLKMTDGVKGLQDGLADIAYISVGNEPSTLPMTSMTMLPGYSVTSVEGTAAFRKLIDDGSEIGKEVAALGITPIVVSDLAAYQVMAKKRLDTPESWVGQKLRVAGSALSFATERIGGTPVQFPAQDLFVAMQQGTVDGTVISFASVKPYSVHEVATHYSKNMSLGTSSSMWAMRTDHFNSLPADQQKVILDCGRQIEPAQAARIDENEGKIAAEVAAMGHEVYEVSPENLEAFAKLMEPVAADLVKRLTELGHPAQQALDEYSAALEAVRAAAK